MEAAVSAIPRLSITGKDSFSRIHRANKLYRSHIYIHMGTHTNSLSILPPCIKIIRINPPATIYTCCGAVEACAEVFLILGDWSPSSDFPISLGKHETRRAAFDTLGCNNIFILSQLAWPRTRFFWNIPPSPCPLPRGNPARPCRFGGTPAEFRFLLSQEHRFDQTFAIFYHYYHCC